MHFLIARGWHMSLPGQDQEMNGRPVLQKLSNFIN
jgi:hypothetical protein